MPETTTNTEEAVAEEMADAENTAAQALTDDAMADTDGDVADADDDMDDVDWGAAMAEQADADAGSALGAVAATATNFQDFGGSAVGKDKVHDIDFILDIPVQLTVELGRTKIPIKNLLQLAQGSVVELDGLAGEPMDVLINGCLIAQGEVVVVNDKFGIRLTDVITPAERIRKLNR